MSGDVITLDGLETRGINESSGDCGKLVEVHAPVLGRSIRVCENDVQRMGAEPAKVAGVSPVTLAATPSTVIDTNIQRRRPGRPRGATVANGARAPRVAQCKTFRTITAKSGREMCKCADGGNGQIVAGRFCGLPKAKEK